MFGWLKKGREPSEAELVAFDEAKQAALERVLGPMHEMVIHAIIPFAMGGGLDLYPFPNFVPGTVYVTQELAGMMPKNRPKRSRIGHYELAAATRHTPSLGSDELVPEMGGHERMISALLNPIARYAFHARLGPGETAEIPGDDGEPSQCIIFDELDTRGVPFEVKGERLALLLVIRVHPQEMAYARKNGGGELLRLLKERGVHPYSDLDRPPVA